MSTTEPTPVIPPDPVSAAKRTIAIKEPPPFKWKLMGYVDGLTVTLLKAVEREDAEAQMTRLEEEGYYRGLEIYPIDAKVPADPQAARHAKEKKARDKAAAQEKARKDAAAAKRDAAAKKASAARKPVTVKALKKPASKPKAAAKKTAKKK